MKSLNSGLSRCQVYNLEELLTNDREPTQILSQLKKSLPHHVRNRI